MRANLLVLATSVLFMAQAEAATIGAVETAGNSCVAGIGTHELHELEEGRYTIPTSLYVKKETDKRVARGACTFAVTLSAAPGHRVVVSDSHQFASLRVYPSQTKARVDLEIFKAGSQGVKNTLEAQSLETTTKQNAVLGQQGVILETECGGSAILRGNLSATVMGEGRARVFTRDLYIGISEVPCQ